MARLELAAGDPQVSPYLDLVDGLEPGVGWIDESVGHVHPLAGQSHGAAQKVALAGHEYGEACRVGVLGVRDLSGQLGPVRRPNPHVCAQHLEGLALGPVLHDRQPEWNPEVGLGTKAPHGRRLAAPVRLEGHDDEDRVVVQVHGGHRALEEQGARDVVDLVVRETLEGLEPEAALRVVQVASFHDDPLRTGHDACAYVVGAGDAGTADLDLAEALGRKGPKSTPRHRARADVRRHAVESPAGTGPA